MYPPYIHSGSFAHDHYHPPVVTPGTQPSIGPWSTGLCDCCQDYNSCCLTCWCPCITFERVAEVLDRGTIPCRLNGVLYTLLLFMMCSNCLYSCNYRYKLRQQHLLEEKPCNDCLIHILCEPCALCQEYRELQNRGFEMSLGWEGNVERQRQMMATTQPAVPWGMTR